MVWAKDVWYLSKLVSFISNTYQRSQIPVETNVTATFMIGSPDKVKTFVTATLLGQYCVRSSEISETFC